MYCELYVQNEKRFELNIIEGPKTRVDSPIIKCGKYLSRNMRYLNFHSIGLKHGLNYFPVQGGTNMTVCGLDHSGFQSFILCYYKKCMEAGILRNVSFCNDKTFDVFIAAHSYDWCAVIYTKLQALQCFNCGKIFK